VIVVLSRHVVGSVGLLLSVAVDDCCVTVGSIVEYAAGDCGTCRQISVGLLL